jgi:hypothetical protein
VKKTVAVVLVTGAVVTVVLARKQIKATLLDLRDQIAERILLSLDDTGEDEGDEERRQRIATTVGTAG